MDHRYLVGLTAATLVLLQLQSYLLPGLRTTVAPVMGLARHDSARAAELRRMGIDLAAAGTIDVEIDRTTATDGPRLLDAVVLEVAARQ
jgi:hypothetical protein